MTKAVTDDKYYIIKQKLINIILSKMLTKQEVAGSLQKNTTLDARIVSAFYDEFKPMTNKYY